MEALLTMGRGSLYYLMIPLMALAALLQSTAFTRLTIGGVKPDLVLLLVVIGTLLYGPGSASCGHLSAASFLMFSAAGPWAVPAWR